MIYPKGNALAEFLLSTIACLSKHKPVIVSLSLNPQGPRDLLDVCPVYELTPLLEVPGLVSGTLLIKDESRRMGMGAFKALGGVYAVARFLMQLWQQQRGTLLAPGRLLDPDLKEFAGHLTFVCASAGNHGLAVAKGAQLFNANCTVFLAETVPAEFASRLHGYGADVIRQGSTYEESMAAAQAFADKKGFVLLADSSWPGYTELPALVMEGYSIIAAEIQDQMTGKSDSNFPSHVFLQAGVGGLAAALTLYIRQYWPKQPEIIVVEPEAAPCLRESAMRAEPTVVSGPVSNMGRLDCKEPSLLALDVLIKFADRFVTVSDMQAQDAAEALTLKGIATTPSGAAGVAAAIHAECAEKKFSAEDTLLAVVTEGAVTA